MKKYRGLWVSMTGLLVLVLLNVVGIAFVAGNCPNVGVTIRKCYLERPGYPDIPVAENYDYGDCRVAYLSQWLLVHQPEDDWVPEEEEDYLKCDGGSWENYEINDLEFGIAGSHIVSNEWVPCTRDVLCEGPVDNDEFYAGIWDLHDPDRPPRLICKAVVLESDHVTYEAGQCPE